MLGGYTRPVLVTHAPGDGRVIFIVEQTGKIKRATFEDGSWKKLGTFLDLSDKVNDPATAGGERGLLGLAFHPDYQSNGCFYVDYTRAGSGARNGRYGGRRVPPPERRLGPIRALLARCW